MRLPALVAALAVGSTCSRATSIPLRLTHPPSVPADARTGPDLASPNQLARESSRTSAKLASMLQGAAPTTGRRLAPRDQAQVYDMKRDSFYIIDVDVGTPAQTLPFLLDTGSCDTVVTTEACHTAACAGLDKFLPGRSSTLQNSSQGFSINYGQGAATGKMAADVVSLGGYTVASQSFALIDQMQDHTVTAPTAGIFGLALQQLCTAGVTPFAETLSKQHVLQEPVFSVQLAREGDTTRMANTSVHGDGQFNQTPDGSSLGGILTLGSLDESQYEGDVHWMDVPSHSVNSGYWSLTLEEVKVNKAYTQKTQMNAVLDTGTTYWAGPPDFVKNFYSHIEGSKTQDDFASGRYSIPCASKVNVSLTFGGRDYPIDHKDFNGGTVNNGTDCIGALFALDSLSSAASAKPSFIIGAVFLKNVFFAANMSGSPSIGLASLRSGESQAVATEVSTPAVVASSSIPATSTLSPSISPTATSVDIPSGVAGLSSATSSADLATPIASASTGPREEVPNTPVGGASKAAAHAEGIAPVSFPLHLEEGQEGSSPSVLPSSILTENSTAAADTMTSATVAATAALEDARTHSGSSSSSLSSLSVGRGSILATASDGSLFASSTTSFTPVSVKPTAATGTAVHWASGVSSPRGFENANRSAASIILHSDINSARAGIRPTGFASVGVVLVLTAQIIGLPG